MSSLSRRQFIGTTGVTLVGLSTLEASRAVEEDRLHDVVVYGGTSAGVTAALRAARLGKSVVLIEPSRHLGGLTAGGLGSTDTGNKEVIGGLAAEFYRRVKAHYDHPEHWPRQEREDYFDGAIDRFQISKGRMFSFEPHVAEQIFERMVAEAGVRVVKGERLDLSGGVQKTGRRIEAIGMESGRVFRGRVFVDATYEGDLMAKAGVAYTVGREPNSRYGERFNGIQKRLTIHHQFRYPVDPYITPGDPSSGLLPEIHGSDPGIDGEGDDRVQAYNFRMCLTDVPENRVPFPKPEGYDPQRYEILLRYIRAGFRDALAATNHMPNRKTDTNNYGPFSTDYVMGNSGYPEGDYETRERIVAEHERYQKGLMYFLANDPRIPEDLQKEVRRWGLAKDEFTDNGHWPHALYVREARRMIGRYVMTEHDILAHRTPEDAIAMGAFIMDSHNCQRYVNGDGHARVEGNLGVSGFDPYPVSYRSITPEAEQCENLLVPVCVSASHVGFGSIRMEPVFMALGHAAGAAASFAVDGEVPVQEVSYARLRKRLLADGQVLEYGGERQEGLQGVQPGALSGVVVDDLDARVRGKWRQGSFGRFVGLGYRHDTNDNKGDCSARFEPELPHSGRYEVRIAYSGYTNRASNTPITIHHANGSESLRISQKEKAPIDDLWRPLGTYRFESDPPAAVEITNEGTDGYVIIDAVQFLPADDG